MKFYYDKIMHEDDGEHWEDFGDDYMQTHAIYVNNKKLARYMQKECKINDYKEFFTHEYTSEDIKEMEYDLWQMGAKFVPVGEPFRWL